MKLLVAIPALCLCGLVAAQSSPSYRLDEFTWNAGGHPQGGQALHSTSYHMRLDSVGGLLAAPTLRGDTYSMDAGFPRSYPPPGEVRKLVVRGDKQTLAWATERSVGTYRVYGGDLQLVPVDYGVCKASDVFVPYVSLDEQPGSGHVFFYLVTAANSLLEEGTTGYDSTGAHRSDPTSCP